MELGPLNSFSSTLKALGHTVGKTGNFASKITRDLVSTLFQGNSSVEKARKATFAGTRVAFPHALGWEYAVKARRFENDFQKLYRGDDELRDEEQYLLQAFSNYVLESIRLPTDQIAGGSSTWYTLFLLCDCLNELQIREPNNSSVRHALELLEECKKSYMIEHFFYKTKSSQANLDRGIDSEMIFSLFLRKLKGEIHSLNENNKTCIFYGSIKTNDVGHSIVYQIQKQEDGTYRFTIFNTGGGIENHATKFLKGVEHVYPLTISGLSLETVSNTQFLEHLLKVGLMLEDRKGDIYELIQKTYDYIDHHLVKKGKGIKHLTSGNPYPSQVKGSCAVSCLNIFLAQHLNDREMQALQKIAQGKLLSRIQAVRSRILQSQAMISPEFQLQQSLSPELQALEEIQRHPQSKL